MIIYIPMVFFKFLSLLLVQSHLSEIIVAKRLIQGHNYLTRIRVEPQSCNQAHRKNDALLSRLCCRQSTARF